MRTLLTLLTALSMLHLTLVGGSVACASHSAMPGMEMSGMPASAMDGMSHGGAEAMKGCASRTQSGCCEAMSSCDVTMTVASVERAIAPPIPAVETPSLASSLNDAVPVAPEPPPPKA